MSQTTISQTTEVELVEAATNAAYDYIAIHGPTAPDFGLLDTPADIFYHLEAGIGGTRWTMTFKTNDSQRQAVLVAIVSNHHDGQLCTPYLAYVSMAHLDLLNAIIGQLELLAGEVAA